MLFNSLNFILFFPAAVLLYWIVPVRYRYVWLVLASYFFYACFDVRCVPILAGMTLVTYLAGRILEKDRSGRKWVMICTVIACLMTLGVFKYLLFFTDNLVRLLARINISLPAPSFSLVLPVGISFYTFKSVSYVADVCKGKIKAENNFLKYALFISFFPQLVAGPIDRADSLLEQIGREHRFNGDDFRVGSLLMLWGYFEKLVVADRISGIVDAVYNDHASYSGAVIAFATICYGIQIYTDFAGYSYLSIGAARILGYRVADNFRQPYLAVNINDFWKRWHISMSSWFRDYVYIPLGGNRKGKMRKYINNMITFLLSGLWHGSSWNFVVWGGLHGLYHVFSGITLNVRNRINDRLDIDKETFGYRFFHALMTFALVDYAWMYFRAGSLSMALDMTRRIVTDFRLYTLSGDWLSGLGLTDAMLGSIPAAFLMVLSVDILHERGLSIIRWLDRQGGVFRWMCYIGAVMLIMLAATQNLGESTGAFIYFRF